MINSIVLATQDICNGLPEWIIYVLIPLVSAFIGGGLTLAGVIVTIFWQSRNKKNDDIQKVKPILINYIINSSEAKDVKCVYYTADDKSEQVNGRLDCVLKNTDNGILFLDEIISERKKYLPTDTSAIDKNTVFVICIQNVVGETLKDIKIHCHDVYDNKYYYEANYQPNNNGSDLRIGSIKNQKK